MVNFWWAHFQTRSMLLPCPPNTTPSIHPFIGYSSPALPMACHLCLLIFQNHQTQITVILLHCLIVWSLQEPLWKEERKEEEQQIGGVGEEKWVILSFIPYWWNLWKFYQVHWCTWWSKIEISGCFSWNLRQKYAKIISFFRV